VEMVMEGEIDEISDEKRFQIFRSMENNRRKADAGQTKI